MVDSSISRPINYSLSSHTNQKSNDFQLIDSKGIPCHVTKVEKDMVTVAFDTHNGVWTVPTMKMPQAFSGNARDATQVGDHGYAVRSNYYLGGNSGLGGGVADYGPRGNLTPLTFHPISRTQNQTRDYDQYTVTGGKTGVKIWQGPVPSQQQQQGGQGQQGQGASSGGSSGSSGGSTAVAAQARLVPHQASLGRSLASLRPPHGRARTFHWRPGGFVAAMAAPRAAPAPLAGSTGSGTSGSGTSGTGSSGSDQGPTGSYMEINKSGLIQHVSQDGKTKVTIDQQGKKITLDTPSDHTVYLGGDGQGQFLPVLCVGNVPAVNVKAKTG